MKITTTRRMDKERITDSTQFNTAIRLSVEKNIRTKLAAFTICFAKVVLIGIVGYLEGKICYGQLWSKKPSFRRKVNRYV
jgi:hypothetical protein